jgi:transposase-like protein
MVEEPLEPGMTASLVARRHGVAPNQLFTWRRLVAQGGADGGRQREEVVPASDHRALQSQVRELQRLLGKKTLEVEILKETLERHGGKKRAAADAVAAEGRFAMKTVEEVIGVSRVDCWAGYRTRSRPASSAKGREARAACSGPVALVRANLQAHRLLDPTLTDFRNTPCHRLVSCTRGHSITADRSTPCR